MNKNYIFGLTGISIVIVIIGAIYLPSIIEQTTYLEDREKDVTLVKEIIDNRDCWAIKDLLDSDEISSGILEIVADNFRAHCDNKAIINDEGIDISNTYELNSSAEFILK